MLKNGSEKTGGKLVDGTITSTQLGVNYAGSSSKGGAATSAAKLTNTSAVGSTYTPVYFTSGGVPTACTATADAASGGTTITTVTTGEKYTWNNKQSTDTAVTHTKSKAVGSETQPVYIASGGGATACTYTLGSSVPASAVIPTSHLYLHGVFFTGSGFSMYIQFVSSDAKYSSGSSALTGAIAALYTNATRSGSYPRWPATGDYNNAIITTAVPYSDHFAVLTASSTSFALYSSTIGAYGDISIPII